MSTTPTVEQFLTQPDDHGPEEPGAAESAAASQPVPEDGFSAPIGDPLESIAHSLHRLTELVVRRDAEQEPMVSAEAYDGLSQEHADLEDKHRALFELLADVEKIVSKSTSKLADSVREAIATWRNPEPAPSENATEMGLEQPAHDAPVEEWRAYARHLGHGRTGAAFNELDQMNRSQIRTAMGIEHGGQD